MHAWTEAHTQTRTHFTSQLTKFVHVYASAGTHFSQTKMALFAKKLIRNVRFPSIFHQLKHVYTVGWPLNFSIICTYLSVRELATLCFSLIHSNPVLVCVLRLLLVVLLVSTIAINNKIQEALCNCKFTLV